MNSTIRAWWQRIWENTWRNCVVLALMLLFLQSQHVASQAVSAPAAGKQHDPYFTPTDVKSTTTIPRVIIRNIREDRAGNIWFATFAGPICYDGKTFTNFSEEVGLAKTRVFSLLVDRRGDLWFGSITGGATRYDGKAFTRFSEKEGLANNDVHWIFEDREGHIWFGTMKGVSRYDGKTMTNFTTKDGLVHNAVYTIAQDATGRMWFGTQGGVCSYDGKSFSNLADQVGRSFKNVRATAIDRSGHLWFGGQDGLFHYDGKTLKRFSTEDGLLDGFVGSMIVDRQGHLWTGHPGPGERGGATRYDGKTFTRFTKKDGLGGETVYCVYEDKAGNIWFGSIDAGVCKYDGKRFTNFAAAAQTSSQVKPEQPANERKPTIVQGEIVSEMPKDLERVFQAKDGRHWFASRTKGAFRYDGKTITRFSSKDGLPGDDVGGIQEDKQGNFYFSTNKGISQFDGRSFTTLEAKAAGEWKLQPDDLWFPAGQDTGAVYRYDGKSLHRLAFPKTKAGDDATLPRDKFPNAKYSPYDVYIIFKDTKGHLWFGTAVLGVCRYDGKTFTWIPEEELRNGSFGTRSIIEDKDGKFWFCNTEHRYVPAGQSFTKEPGIRDSRRRLIGGIMSAVNHDGVMWMATYGDGVWRYDGKELTHYPVMVDGKGITLFTISKDHQGVLWLGTHANGALKFNGKSFERFRR